MGLKTAGGVGTTLSLQALLHPLFLENLLLHHEYRVNALRMKRRRILTLPHSLASLWEGSCYGLHFPKEEGDVGEYLHQEAHLGNGKKITMST